MSSTVTADGARTTEQRGTTTRRQQAANAPGRFRSRYHTVKVMGPTYKKKVTGDQRNNRQSRTIDDGAGTAILKQQKSNSRSEETIATYTGGKTAQCAVKAQVHVAVTGQVTRELQWESQKEHKASFYAGCAEGHTDDQVDVASAQKDSTTSTRLEYAASVAKAKVKFKDKIKVKDKDNNKWPWLALLLTILALQMFGGTLNDSVKDDSTAAHMLHESPIAKSVTEVDTQVAKAGTKYCLANMANSLFIANTNFKAVSNFETAMKNLMNQLHGKTNWDVQWHCIWPFWPFWHPLEARNACAPVGGRSSVSLRIKQLTCSTGTQTTQFEQEQVFAGAEHQDFVREAEQQVSAFVKKHQDFAESGAVQAFAESEAAQVFAGARSSSSLRRARSKFKPSLCAELCQDFIKEQVTSSIEAGQVNSSIKAEHQERPLFVASATAGRESAAYAASPEQGQATAAATQREKAGTLQAQSKGKLHSRNPLLCCKPALRRQRSPLHVASSRRHSTCTLRCKPLKWQATQRESAGALQAFAARGASQDLRQYTDQVQDFDVHGEVQVFTPRGATPIRACAHSYSMACTTVTSLGDVLEYSTVPGRCANGQGPRALIDHRQQQQRRLSAPACLRAADCGLRGPLRGHLRGRHVAKCGLCGLLWPAEQPACGLL